MMYLGLVGHPRINEAAKKAVDKFGTGTHGVRSLAGTLTIHTELEETISNFKHAEAALTYSSGYATNLSVVSTLMGRGDYVFSDTIEPRHHRGRMLDVWRGVPPLPP